MKNLLLTIVFIAILPLVGYAENVYVVVGSDGHGHPIYALDRAKSQQQQPVNMTGEVANSLGVLTTTRNTLVNVRDGAQNYKQTREEIKTLHTKDNIEVLDSCINILDSLLNFGK